MKYIYKKYTLIIKKHKSKFHKFIYDLRVLENKTNKTIDFDFFYNKKDLKIYLDENYKIKL